MQLLMNLSDLERTSMAALV